MGAFAGGVRTQAKLLQSHGIYFSGWTEAMILLKLFHCPDGGGVPLPCWLSIKGALPD